MLFFLLNNLLNDWGCSNPKLYAISLTGKVVVDSFSLAFSTVCPFAINSVASGCWCVLRSLLIPLSFFFVFYLLMQSCNGFKKRFTKTTFVLAKNELLNCFGYSDNFCESFWVVKYACLLVDRVLFCLFD